MATRRRIAVETLTHADSKRPIIPTAEYQSVVEQETQEPIRGEFRQVFEEQKFGLPLAESLLGLSDRVNLVDVRMFVTSVLIQKETGGNLAENMANLAHVIRERFRFRRQIKTHTAHGRMTGAVLAVTPLVMLFLLNVVSPDYMGPMS